jgi:hypothetical protein
MIVTTRRSLRGSLLAVAALSASFAPGCAGLFQPRRVLFSAPSPFSSALSITIDASEMTPDPDCAALDLDAAAVAGMMRAIERRFLREVPEPKTTAGIIADLAITVLRDTGRLPAPEEVYVDGKWYTVSPPTPMYDRREMELVAPRLADALRKASGVRLRTNAPPDADPEGNATDVGVACYAGESLLGFTTKPSFEWSFAEVGGLDFRVPGATSTIGYYEFDGWRWDYMMVAPHAPSGSIWRASFDAPVIRELARPSRRAQPRRGK